MISYLPLTLKGMHSPKVFLFRLRNIVTTNFTPFSFALN